MQAAAGPYGLTVFNAIGGRKIASSGSQWFPVLCAVLDNLLEAAPLRHLYRANGDSLFSSLQQSGLWRKRVRIDIISVKPDGVSNRINRPLPFQQSSVLSASIVVAAENAHGGSRQRVSWLASTGRLPTGISLVKRLLRTHLGEAPGR